MVDIIKDVFTTIIERYPASIEIDELCQLFNVTPEDMRGMLRNLRAFQCITISENGETVKMHVMHEIQSKDDIVNAFLVEDRFTIMLNCKNGRREFANQLQEEQVIVIAEQRSENVARLERGPNFETYVQNMNAIN